MSTICEAQPARVVILSKEERCIRAVNRVLVKELVHGFQQALRLIQRDRAQASKVRLKICHQQSRRDSFTGDVPDDQPDPFPTEVKKIVVITANRASLNADTCVVE